MAALVVGCSGPTAPAAAPAPAEQSSQAAAHKPADAQGGAGEAEAPGQRGDSSVGHVQLVHMAPNAPAFDVYFARLGQDGKLIGSGGYGNVNPYMTLPPGRYVWSMRPTGSAPNSPLSLTKLLEVKGGETSSAVLFNNGANGALQGVVVPEDATVPATGSAKIRVMQGANGAPMSVTVGSAAPQRIAYGDVTPYQTVPAGPMTVKTDATPTPMTADLASGSLTTVVVTRNAQGAVQLAPFTDTTTGSPLAASTPTGVNTGSGGMAAQQASGTEAPIPAGLLAGAGILLLVGGVVVARRRAS
jgi:hypothetical protein